MKISVVVTGRNDNYDGNFDERLIVALGRNINSLPDAEFIFVEWNPHLDRPLVSEKLQKVFGNKVNYYVVHPRYHKDYCSIDDFLEYPAKNVGIRRASHAYIACINSDIVFCPDLIDSIKRGLRPNILYRATRIDIKLEHLYVCFPLDEKQVLEKNYGYMNAAGDFLLMHHNLWHLLTGYCEEYPEQRLHKDAQPLYILSDRKHYSVMNIGAITHWRHPSSWSNGKCRAKVGDPKWDFKNCGYEKNKDTWGLTFAKEINKDGIIWLM
jgi:hypothetical protein